MSKTSMIAKMKAQPGQRDAIVAALTDAMAATESEEGTLIFAINLDKADPDTVWMYELYTDDAALGVHGGSESTAALFGAVGGLLAEPPLLVLGELHSAMGIEA